MKRTRRQETDAAGGKTVLQGNTDTSIRPHYSDCFSHTQLSLSPLWERIFSIAITVKRLICVICKPIDLFFHI